RRFTRDEMTALGLAEVLSKPVRQLELQRTLQRVMPAQPLGMNPILAITAVTEPASRPSEESYPYRILVAEDNPVNVRVTLMQLRKLGCQADVAGNGLEVLEAVKRVPYDIVLMDCQMPEMDGYEAARWLRQRPDGSRLRIIA